MNLKMFKAFIRRHRSFVISTHVNPDPDAICTELALADYLRALGKRVRIINEEDPLPRFDFIKGIKYVKGMPSRPVKFDALIVVDCGELGRIGKVQRLLPDGCPIMNIDHHITNDRFGTVNLIDVKSSSSAELLYRLIKHARGKISKRMAWNLYTGIMTDTGSFRYENTTEETHRITAELLGHGFSPTDIYQKIYDTVPLNDLKELLKVACQFETRFNDRVVLVELKRSAQKRFSEAFDLRDAIFKLLRSIDTAEAIFILTELSSRETRVNMRSTKRVDVAKIAGYFQGGGHKRASGCVIKKGMKQAKQGLLRRVGKEF